MEKIQEKQQTYERNIETRSCNHCCCGKAISIKYSECVFVDLGIQHALRMRRITLPYVACPNLQYFGDYLINGRIFEKKIMDRKIFVLIFSTNLF